MVLALSLTLRYVLGFFSISGLFESKFGQNYESVFEVNLGGLEVAGHDFGTVFHIPLLFGIRFDSWALPYQIGPAFQKCVLRRYGEFGGRWSRFWHCL